VQVGRARERLCDERLSWRASISQRAARRCGVGDAATIALVVEDDPLQRDLVVAVLEGSDLGVVQCESAEAAVQVLEKIGACVSMLITDVNLAGRIDGVELAHISKQSYPNIHVVVTSGRALKKALPDGAMFLPKPWFSLDLLREVDRSQHWARP
jgi:two-component system cell cycle response regulator CpdR